MEIFDRLKAKGILEARVGFRGKNGDINLTELLSRMPRISMRGGSGSRAKPGTWPMTL